MDHSCQCRYFRCSWSIRVNNQGLLHILELRSRGFWLISWIFKLMESRSICPIYESTSFALCNFAWFALCIVTFMGYSLGGICKCTEKSHLQWQHYHIYSYVYYGPEETMMLLFFSLKNFLSLLIHSQRCYCEGTCTHTLKESRKPNIFSSCKY